MAKKVNTFMNVGVHNYIEFIFVGKNLNLRRYSCLINPEFEEFFGK